MQNNNINASQNNQINIDQFAALLDGAKKSGDGYRACCPAHGGKDPNLAVWTRDDGTIGTKCYSHGCDRKDVIEAVGYSLSDILPSRTQEEIKVHREIVNDRTLKTELRIELLIILQWADPFYKKLFPDLTDDDERIKLAFSRTHKGLNYFGGKL